MGRNVERTNTALNLWCDNIAKVDFFVRSQVRIKRLTRLMMVFRAQDELEALVGCVGRAMS